MPRTPSEYAIHLLIEGGHREEVRFRTLQEFQQWYKETVVPQNESRVFVNVPIKTAQGEYMVIRPAAILAIRVEPIYTSSIERFEDDET